MPVQAHIDGIFYIYHLQIFYQDILHHAASGGSGFDAEAAVCAVILHIADRHIADAAGGLTSKGYSATCEYLAVLDQYVLTDTVHPQAICISS